MIRSVELIRQTANQSGFEQLARMTLSTGWLQALRFHNCRLHNNMVTKRRLEQQTTEKVYMAESMIGMMSLVMLLDTQED